MQQVPDFRTSTVYQIYPKSFKDSNGDGLGDIRGVIEKLDYIAGLGVDYIWSTPFFVSPQHDNGYDVADYFHVDPAYGTMSDVEELIAEADKRGIGLMFDMVFNHVSTEHEWFRRAMQGDPYYKDFFFFKKPQADGSAPTNWESKFGGSAWQYVPEFDEYYLHLFDSTQADLNWENPHVREEIRKILRFWMNKGVRGFRFDVINLISKAAFENDYEGDGRRFYTDGPKVHEYLREMNEATFGNDPRFVTVGEMSSTSLEQCYKYAGADSHELKMVFSFHHLKVDFAGNEKWVLVPADFMKLKSIMFDWQVEMAKHNAWNAVFWCNHDQPRVVSRFGDDRHYWYESATMLATIIHALRGTPYVYQGEELGMTNTDYTSIEQFNDVESLNHYRILQDKGLDARDALRIVQIHSRDNARTPMQWDTTAHGGFTDSPHGPWLATNSNYHRINAAEQVANEHSIYHYYQKLIALRKELPVIAFGDITPLAQTDPQVFAYKRTLSSAVASSTGVAGAGAAGTGVAGTENTAEQSVGEDSSELLVVANFYGRDYRWQDAPNVEGYECILNNYEHAQNGTNVTNTAHRDPDPQYLRPFEAQIWYKKK